MCVYGACFFSLVVLKYVVYLCRVCDGCCGLCLNCEAWGCMCSCMGSMSVSSCRCCMFMSCVHPVAVLNAAFCMTCSLLMLAEDARGAHMEEGTDGRSMLDGVPAMSTRTSALRMPSTHPAIMNVNHR